MGPIGKLLFWIGWPLSYVFGRGERTRVLIMRNGAILLVKDLISADDAWGLPGGGLHHSETPQRGAVREVREETGLIITKPRMLTTEPRNNHGLRFTAHYMQAEPAEQTAGRRSLEIRAVQWIRLDQLNTEKIKSDVSRALELAGLL